MLSQQSGYSDMIRESNLEEVSGRNEGLWNVNDSEEPEVLEQQYDKLYNSEPVFPSILFLQQ